LRYFKSVFQTIKIIDVEIHSKKKEIKIPYMKFVIGYDGKGPQIEKVDSYWPSALVELSRHLARVDSIRLWARVDLTDL